MSDTVEFSRPQVADEIGPKKLEFSFEADETERNALAARFELQSLEYLSAALSVMRSDKTAIVEVQGHFTASYSQNCVVTLVPVALAVEEPIEAFFSDDVDMESEVEINAEIDVERPDAPEPIIGNVIDLGELVAQQFAISMDPYPRAPGVEIPTNGVSFGAKVGESEEDHPFAALRRLK
jgi:hypothetical protein